MSGEESNNDDDRKRAADGILEMLREAGVSTADLEDKKHAFWDTQVSVFLCLFACLLASNSF